MLHCFLVFYRSICSNHFQDLHLCCDLPKLMEFAVYNKCMSALETSAKLQMEKTATKRKSASFADMLISFFKVDSRKGQRSENMVALPPGSTCVMDCMFKNYNNVSMT
ncbi:UNVERIFIED_CONTAM: hypothetical protein B566_EDAN019157 [Ephemera danica]|nr:hypothetical protein B566_EDAN019157 [Ephemera danica]